ncbi:MAG: translocation/assembly module TamB [Gemmatimonadaceae bacterium]|nr:translocation/assembly module TamB [Gemmatimonadaceae bacterium]
MSARQRRLGWAAALVAALVAGVSLTYVWATNSAAGREWLLARLVSTIDGAFDGRGHLRVGVLRDISWGHIEADSVSIVDSAGVAIISIESLEGRLDFPALLDRKIHLHALTIRTLRVALAKDFKGPWNFAYLLSGTPSTTPQVRGAPGFGDDIKIDTLRLSDGVITTSAPWAPHPVFTGTARDSVIAVRDSLHDLLRTPNGLLERRRITLDRLVGVNGVIMDPMRRPSRLTIDSLTGIISDPPVRIAGAAGLVTWTPDSLRLNLPVLQLPASRGSAEGRVWWNQPGAVRFDVAIKTEAGLSDLTWIWDVLPKTGGGTASVRMRTLESADDAEYTLTSLDVASMESRITGQIQVVVHPASIELQQVALDFAPISSALLRRLSYEALPATVNGMMRGRLVAARGGPLTNFLIDTLNAEFRDGVVPDATSSLRAHGTVAMGAAPAAREVVIDAMRADLRTVRALSADLPAFDGMVEGKGRVVAADLTSATLRDLALTWTDGANNVSSIRGDAQVDIGPRVPRLTLALVVDSVALRALARIDTTFTVRSTLSGTIAAAGALDSLTWRLVARADSAGRLTLDGIASLQSPAWRVSGGGALQTIDAARWLGRTDVPVTAISGTVNFAANGAQDSAGLATVERARAALSLTQPEADSRPAFDLLASLDLDPRRVRVDSALMHVGGITLDAKGTLARAAVGAVGAAVALSDTLVVSATADSLDAVRRQLTRLAATMAPVDSASAASLRSFASDTLRGDASLSGYLIGSLDDFDATLALGAREMQVGAIRIGRVFGSLRAEQVRTRASFEGVATADELDGIGAIRIASAEFRVLRANPDSGALVLDASSVDDAHLVVRGAYARSDGRTTVTADSLRFVYDSVAWNNAAPIRVVSDSKGLVIDSLQLSSSRAGSVSVRASVPTEGTVDGMLYLDQFPIAEAAAFAMGTSRYAGLLSGNATLRGTRQSPLISWRMFADSLGLPGSYLPRVSTDGEYANRVAIARASITDSAGGRLYGEARVPVDLSIATVEKRLLSEAVDADVKADSLRLEALDIGVAGIERVKGSLAGHIVVTGTMDRPVGTGSLTLTQFSAHSTQMGIEPVEGRAVVRAAQDSLILETFRMRSGDRAGDTLNISGGLRYALNEPATVRAKVFANTFVGARQRDGSSVIVSGALDVVGPLRKPDVSGVVNIPLGLLAIDPLNASTALDLTSESARWYLGTSEQATVDAAGASLFRVGDVATVSNVRVELGNDVWVRTPEASVRLTGSVNVSTKDGVLVPEGEINANRGQYRLDLGVVTRSFSVDSGRVRFFGDAAIGPTLDISATNTVKLATGDDIPVGVHIGGTIEKPVLTLSSADPLYASAPESEIISLLIFGAPTFALDGQSQSTVRAVTGVLLPTVGGAVEGVLQELLPVKFNTFQVSTAGGQSTDELSSVSSLLSTLNLSISAGKQVGERTFLRLNTGICRGAAQTSLRGANLWYGVAAEYRLSRGLSAQVGVDPGSAPCSRIGGDVFPRMQFGFDLFREWIF